MPSVRLELCLFLLYVSLGPVTWAGYGVMLFAGRRRMLLMKRPPHPITRTPPRATILVPAKDEGERIRACIESCLAQEYPDFEVIAIDDRSTDDTGAVMDTMACANARLRVLHVTEPPKPGWTGKNNALHQGQKLADGQWMLFVDSDVVLQPDALGVAMSVVLRKNFDMISLLPRLESHTIWESTLVPLAAGAASSLFLIALNNMNAMRRNAFANGQFLMISRTAYEAIGGHDRVKDRYCEDVAIAQLMKDQGLRPRVSWGNDFAAVRMYSSLGAIFRGWSRIYYAAQVGRPWRILIGMAFLLLCTFTGYVALAWGIFRLLHPVQAILPYPGAYWFSASGLHLVLMTYFLATIYRWSGNPGRNALLFPVSGTMLMGIFLKALKMCVTRKVEWRGTAYSHTMASRLDPTAGASPTLPR